MQATRLPLQRVLLRCEGGDDLFEARVATQRVPPGQQFQFTIAEPARRTDSNGKLLASQVVVACPCGDQREILNHCWHPDRVLFDRTKLDGATSLAQCFFFASQSSVDQTQHAPRRPEIWLSLNYFLLLGPCGHECDARLVVVFGHAIDKPFNEPTIGRYFNERRFASGC